jgi:hypothetical protein
MRCVGRTQNFLMLNLVVLHNINLRLLKFNHSGNWNIWKINITLLPVGAGCLGSEFSVLSAVLLVAVCSKCW